tara:strand:- start:3088 stop:3651 length:564 start_codon:yes stop_codon:yes gene_type:complete
MTNYGKIDFNRFFTLVNKIGPVCDDRKNRFDKADLLEQGIEVCSDETYKWADAVGYDHVFTPTQEKIEVKSQKNVLYTKTGKLKSSTKSIKLMNSLGSTDNRQFPCRFDKLMIIDTGSPKSYSIGLVDWQTVNKYTEGGGDGFSAKIPTSEISFVCIPKNVTIGECKNADYMKQKREMQRQFVAGAV